MSKESDAVMVWSPSTKYANTYEVRAYVGSRRYYNGAALSEQDVIDVIAREQKLSGEKIPVRMTKTEFICDDYREEGWELAAINYPRHPKEKKTILDFMLQLGKSLCFHLEQNRVSVIAPDRTTMFESPDAVESHKEPLS